MKKHIFLFALPLVVLTMAVALVNTAQAQTVTPVTTTAVVCPAGFTCTPISSLCPAGFTCVSTTPQQTDCPEGYICQNVMVPPTNSGGGGGGGGGGNTCYNFTTNLRIGSTGAGVAALQTWLIARGFSLPRIQSGATAKGYYGRETATAVRQYQTSVGIEGSGNFGVLTRASVNRSCTPTTLPSSSGISVVSPAENSQVTVGVPVSIAWSVNWGANYPQKTPGFSFTLYSDLGKENIAENIVPVSAGCSGGASSSGYVSGTTCTYSYTWTPQAPSTKALLAIYTPDMAIPGGYSGSFSIIPCAAGYVCTTPVISNGISVNLSANPGSLAGDMSDRYVVPAGASRTFSFTISADNQNYGVYQNQTITGSNSSVLSLTANPGSLAGDMSDRYVVPAGASRTFSFTATAGNANLFVNTVQSIAVTPQTGSNPSITVTSPNGGEGYYTGNTVPITWNTKAVSQSDTVKIELGFKHTDTTYPGGMYFEDWIAEKVPNTGSYNWVIPEFYGTGLVKDSFVVKVTSKYGIDYSDHAFSIKLGEKTGTIVVSQPVTGSSYRKGGTAPLAWNASGDSVGTSLLRTSDPSFIRLTLAGTAGGWVVPKDVLSGNDYYIKVTEGSYRNNTGYSGTFSIVGEDTPPGSPSVSATLVDASTDRIGSNFGQSVGIGNRNPADWHFRTTVSSKPGTYIKEIYITSNYGEGWSTTGRSATRNDLYPLYVAGKAWENTMYNEVIPADAGPTLDLYAQPELGPFPGGTIVVNFTDGTSAQATIPASTIRQAIGVACATNDSRCANSSTYISVLTPNTGESLTKGSTYNIRWSSAGISSRGFNIKLGECTLDPCAKAVIARNISLPPYGNDTQNYSWNVGSFEAGSGLEGIVDIGRYKIVIESVDNPSIFDSSDSSFNIVSTNRAPVITGGTFPASLKVGEQGTWTVNAYDPESGPLSYRVVWGDEPVTVGVKAAIAAIQSSSFTHVYYSAGTYNPIFYVTDNAGNTAQTSATVSVGGTTQTNGQVVTTVDPASPLQRLVNISTSAETDNVVLGIFDLKSQNVNSTLRALKLHVNTSGASISTIFNDIKIKAGSLIYSAYTIPGEGTSGDSAFVNLNIPLPADQYIPVTIIGKVAKDTYGNITGSSATVSLVSNSTNLQVEDGSYNTVPVVSSTLMSSATSFSSNSALVSNTSATLGSPITSNNTTSGYGMTMSFVLTAGDSTLYLAANPGTALLTTSTGYATAVTTSANLSDVTANPGSIAGDTAANNSTGYYVIPAGSSRQFTYAGAVRASAASTLVTFKIVGIRYGVSPAYLTGSKITNNLDALKVTALFPLNVSTPTPTSTYSPAPSPTYYPYPSPSYSPTPTPTYYPTPSPSASPSASINRSTMSASFYTAAQEFCRVNREYSSWPICVAVR